MKMEQVLEPKHSYGRICYIRKGFYRGYKAEIKAFEKVTIKIQETGEEQTYIIYKVKIVDVPMKELYDIKEDWLVPYKKWVFF
jgi:hypothetical protein